MVYMGSKNRIAPSILPIMLKARQFAQAWVEPFVGGANMIDKVDGVRIGADRNEYLVAMLVALSRGHVPVKVSRETYVRVRSNPGGFHPAFVGWCAIGCSYSGKWFGGFAGTSMSDGALRDYQRQTINNVKAQAELLIGIDFRHSHFEDLVVPHMSLIYCDPPYEGVKGYKDAFDHGRFWDWARRMAKEGHTVFVSEYSAPDDFMCVWEQEIKSSLGGRSKKSVEKLFTI